MGFEDNERNTLLYSFTSSFPGKHTSLSLFNSFKPSVVFAWSFLSKDFLWNPCQLQDPFNYLTHSFVFVLLQLTWEALLQKDNFWRPE